MWERIALLTFLVKCCKMIQTEIVAIKLEFDRLQWTLSSQKPENAWKLQSGIACISCSKVFFNEEQGSQHLLWTHWATFQYVEPAAARCFVPIAPMYCSHCQFTQVVCWLVLSSSVESGKQQNKLHPCAEHCVLSSLSFNFHPLCSA